MKNKIKSLKADAKYYFAAAAITIPVIMAGALCVKDIANTTEK